MMTVPFKDGNARNNNKYQYLLFDYGQSKLFLNVQKLNYIYDHFIS